jgi:hypothetical protein
MIRDLRESEKDLLALLKNTDLQRLNVTPRLPKEKNLDLKGTGTSLPKT